MSEVPLYFLTGKLWLAESERASERERERERKRERSQDGRHLCTLPHGACTPLDPCPTHTSESYVSAFSQPSNPPPSPQECAPVIAVRDQFVLRRGAITGSRIGPYAAKSKPQKALRGVSKARSWSHWLVFCQHLARIAHVS